MNGISPEVRSTGFSRVLPQISAFSVTAVLSSLVDKNMVCRGHNPKLADQVRYGLLETTREFGKEALSGSGEKEEIQRKHAEFVCKLVEETEPRLVGPEVVEALDLMESEIGNIRAALGFSKEEQGSRTGLRIVGALRKFWLTRGFVREGTGWVKEFTHALGGSPDALQAKFLATAGVLANHRGDYEEAAELLERALHLSEKLGDKRKIADALGFAGVVRLRQSLLIQAEELLSRAVSLSRGADDPWLTGSLLVGLATVAHCLGNDDESFGLNSEAVELMRSTVDKRALCVALNNLGLLEGHKGEMAFGLGKLHESLLLANEIGADPATMTSLESLAEIACLQQCFERAVRLLAAARAGRRETGARIQPANESECQELLEQARRHLSHDKYEGAWCEGQAMSIEEAVEYALEGDTDVLGAQVTDDRSAVQVVQAASTAGTASARMADNRTRSHSSPARDR